MKIFTTVKIPKEARDSIRIVQAHIALHGMEGLPEWLQEILLKGKRPLNTMNVACAGILVLALLERGKSMEEIKRMGRDEVRGLLREGRYPNLLETIRG